ncbi:MAG TPA: D-alanyl-D-alanine carboxypeptidase/D-alanyl-D-alanine-endopeptidase [Candidatus Acidoferrales bacterium]|nr:D-alanyl-D-alanine carboxypeptidase/D-alanyl-D-alanine-endopeptidase [Candidatus Acidoferrales bacterium]
MGALKNIALRIAALSTAAILLPAMFAAHGSAHNVSRANDAHATEVGKSRPDVARFRARVEAVLGQGNAEKLDWGIEVADRDTGETIYEWNGDHFFTPASNAKIVTTALALATLGADYRFHTTLESKSPVGSDGRLAGDLILVGRGDPDLSNRRFPYVGRGDRVGAVEKVLAEMADEAIAKGLREVDGDIVADDSYFPYDPYPAGWSTGDLFFAFAAPVSAIAFNDNTISVLIEPGARSGDPAVIRTEPVAGLAMFTEEITTGPPDTPSDFAVVRQPGAGFILLRGTIALGRTPTRVDIAMTEPAATAALALKQLLEARGVRITGTTRAQHAAPPYSNVAGEPVIPDAMPALAAPPPVTLAEHISEPLLESIRVTNKMSHNLHAELLLRAVGREKIGVGSTAAGLKAEREFLRTAGVTDGDLLLSDGSGLARDDLVTPRAMVTLLRDAARQPWGKDFLSTLPVAGMDGTLEGRMTGTPASGRIEAKTGEIEHVRALSGYATTLRGESLVFAIFYNNNPQHGLGTVAPVDAIATALVETLGTEPRAKKK